MAANSNVLLARLCDQLSSIYDLSVARKKRYERVVRDCRELLRPWPKTEEVKPTVDASNGKTSKSISGVYKTEDIIEDSSIPVAELAALELAKKALTQAQNIRVKQAKVLEKEVNRQKEEKLLSGEELTSNGQQPVSVTQKESVPTAKSTRKYEPPLSNKQVTTKPATSFIKANSTGQRSAKPQGTANRAKPPPGERAKSGVKSAGQSSQLKAQTVRGGSGRQSAGRIDNKNVGIIQQSSLTRVLGPTKTGGKPRPGHNAAHTTAPFKTEPTAHRVKNQPTRTSTLRQAAAQRQGSASSVGHRKSQRDLEHVSREASDSVDPNPNNHLPPSNNDVTLENRATPGSVGAGDEITPQPSMHWSDVECREASIEGNKTRPSSASESTEDPGAPALFDLLVDGQNLSIPVKLRKAIAMNKKLRQQVEMASLTAHASPETSPTSSFLNKLTDYYDEKTNQKYKDAVQMLALYKRLYTLMEKLQNRKIDGDATWQDILRTKRSMENVCLLYADMEENYHNCVQGLEAGTMRCPTTVSGPDTQPASVWLPSSILTEPLTLRPTVRYKRLRAAENYQRLLHEAQLLTLNLRVMALVAETLLPLLKSMSGSHSSFHSLYRAAYMLLCTSTNRQPIIILDSMDDETTN